MRHLFIISCLPLEHVNVNSISVMPGQVYLHQLKDAFLLQTQRATSLLLFPAHPSRRDVFQLSLHVRAHALINFYILIERAAYV